jgi:DNA-binding CsgD family transcriptional regulator
VPPTRNPGAGLLGRRGECKALDQLVAGVRAGQSQVLVLRGEAGVGKTSLLNYVVGHASGCRVERAAGAESEMELPFAGLQQLCAPMLDALDRLPGPQRDALATAFGLSSGDAPDRFLVGLAVLSLLAEVAEEKPLVCLIDDAQWLDRVSAQTLAFVARRLLAEQVALVFAVREPGDEHEFSGLKGIHVRGLPDDDARALLGSVIRGPVDERVRDRILAETRGNPLALLELPRGLTPAELAAGFGLHDTAPLTSRIEDGFLRRLEALPDQTRRLLLIAAAEPVGDAASLWRAIEQLEIPPEALAPAEAAGLIEIGAQVRFRHPLVRSAAYRSASTLERQDAHRALAQITDPDLDPDRRAWHRAQATPGPDEDIAAELERSAGRAQARGGLAAAAVFLENAAILTPGTARRAERHLAAAWGKRDAGALDAALDFLVAVEAGPPDALRAGSVKRLRGQIALDQRHAREATPLLLSAAKCLEPLDAGMARETHMEALGAAMWATGLDGENSVRDAAEAARGAPPAATSPRPVDIVLEAVAARFTDGYAAAAPVLANALEALRTPSAGEDDVSRSLWLAGNNVSGILALELWDFESRHALGERQLQLARETGALLQLQFALNFHATTHLLAGRLEDAASLIDEDNLIEDATGNPAFAYCAVGLAAFRGREPQASDLIEATVLEAAERGLGRVVSFAVYASAVLYNGLGQHEAARDAARRILDYDVLGYGTCAVAELAEAASRTGDEALVRDALEWLGERTRVAPTDWALGIEARVRALLSDGGTAAGLYEESLDRLGRTRLRNEVARGHLLYGEWLRREGRRVDARVQLRTAHEMLTAMGFEAFAERARRELSATGETARKRTAESRDDLTAQEAQIARFAIEGLSNPEIGTRLFISPRTVEWHLRKIFTKLGIASRKELRKALPDSALLVVST